jgi:hypothetical protein
VAYITSKWSAVQDYLLTLLTGVAPSGTLMGLGAPHPDELAASGVRAWIPLDTPDPLTQTFSQSSGLVQKVETWQQDLIIYATILTPDGKVARDRVDAVLHPFLGTLSNDPLLGGLVMLAEVTSVSREEAAPDHSTRKHAATVRISVSAWIGQEGD